MRAHRLTIKSALSISIVTLISSFVLVLYSAKFLENWFAYFLALIVGLFTSSLIILITSIVNLNVRKKEIACDYILLLMQFRTEVEQLNLFYAKHKVKPGVASISTDEASQLEHLYKGLVDILTPLLSLERMSWLSQKNYDRHIKRLPRNKLAYIEPTFKKLCAEASAICTTIYSLLRRLPLYEDEKQHAECLNIISEKINSFEQLTRPKGELDLCINNLESIILKLLEIPET